MKILVTGATGFIGQYLVRALIEQGDNVVVLCRASSNIDVLPKEVSCILLPDTQIELEVIFEREKFDGVIHLASLYLMSHQPEDIENLIDSNIKLGTKVINAATKTNVKFFINTGSFAQHYESRPYSPTNLYAATKQAFQDIVQYYVETSKTNIITLELFNTYGPGDTRNKVMNLWHNAITEDKVLDMSPGEQIIDISYITDVVNAFLIAIKHITGEKAQNINGKTYTLKSPERMTLKELSQVFAEVLDTELKVNFGAFPYRYREIMAPMDKGEVLPEWSPNVTIREGIRLTFLDNK